MDALPIEEATGFPYSSRNEGVMHACGHDGNTAMLLGTASILAKHREQLKGTVKFICQPAEEGGHGEMCIRDRETCGRCVFGHEGTAQIQMILSEMSQEAGSL